MKYSIWYEGHSECQRYIENFDEAYQYAVSLLSNPDKDFTLDLMREEMERLGTCSITEKGAESQCYSESVNIVDTTKHEVDEDGRYEW
jgi:hypothetical protein